MDLLEGPSLADLVHRKRLSVESAIDVAVGVLRGLEAMHECGVIHRDVKPANIVLQPSRDGGLRRPVLVDLGVGRFVGAMEGEEITVADRVVGTFEYMAPEQILSSHTATASVDVYAVGALLFRAVAGAHPYGDKHGMELLRAKLHEPIPRLSTGRKHAAAVRFEDLVSRALAFEAADRFASAADFRRELEALRLDDARPAPRTVDPSATTSRNLARFNHRQRAVAIAAISAAAFAACSTDDVPAKEPPVASAEMLVCR
jgi:serine/threonine protein kinase